MANGRAPQLEGQRASAEAPLVTVVVLSYGSSDDTIECLASLEQCAYPRMNLLLLDGDLSPEAVHRVRTSFPRVRRIALTGNRGYAGNNNVGIDAALDEGADWVFLLNNDTVVDPDCVGRLVDAVIAAPAAGIAGPMVLHHRDPDVIQSAGGRTSPLWWSGHIGQNEPDRHQFTETRPVDWVSGCALMASQRVIEAVGGLDERYFMYCEELEWCLRARRAGFSVLHVPGARVWHKGVRRDYQPSPAVTYYMTRNLLLTLWIHRASRVVRLVRSLQILRSLITWSVRPKWRRTKAAHRDAMWRGARDYLRGRFGPMPG